MERHITICSGHETAKDFVHGGQICSLTLAVVQYSSSFSLFPKGGGMDHMEKCYRKALEALVDDPSLEREQVAIRYEQIARVL